MEPVPFRSEKSSDVCRHCGAPNTQSEYNFFGSFKESESRYTMNPTVVMGLVIFIYLLCFSAFIAHRFI